MSEKRELRVYVDWEGKFQLFGENDEEPDLESCILVDYDEVETKAEEVKFFRRAREHYLREAAEFGLSFKALFRIKQIEHENKDLRKRLEKAEREIMRHTGLTK